MEKLRDWWSSLPDCTLLGRQLCFAASGGWRSFYLHRSRECFHNGRRWIPGWQLNLAGFVLQVSRAADWCSESD